MHRIWCHHRYAARGSVALSYLDTTRRFAYASSATQRLLGASPPPPSIRSSYNYSRAHSVPLRYSVAVRPVPCGVLVTRAEELTMAVMLNEVAFVKRLLKARCMLVHAGLYVRARA